MRAVTIHESGDGADKLTVTSYGGGLSYTFQFGAAGHPMWTLFFQGDDATDLRAEFDNAESVWPDRLTRTIWLDILDPYI